MYKLMWPILFAIGILVLGGCSQATQEEKNTQADDEKLKIYTTIFPLQNFSEKIGGEFVEVENIVPTGSDAHSFEPTTKTMIKIAEGDAFIYLGTGIEGFADAVISAVKNEDTAIVKASEGTPLIGAQKSPEDEHEVENDEAHAGEEGEVDPHVWLDPGRSVQLAENIKNALIKIDPSQQDYFEKNFQALKADLETVDSNFESMVNESKNKTFIVAHSAYGYWEDAYGLKQIGISGLSPSAEPSQKQLEEIIKTAENAELDYILFEQNVENRVAEVIKRELGAETLTLHNLESLTEEDIQNNEDYISLMNKNIETLKQALNNT
ncbi:metal ABC transporter substrate-binding protein [Cytobacillus sp. FSL W8-0315]|uniref:metal ABC transporter substrate-binding protein n=2 Tax=Bacillaceae TaxID=186817 RepID=UPI0002F10DDC|nr:metal ABC transporter substrate-binding protein [Cytobacillus pseudoceanisediminis]UQX57158.1 metal ABC transporter substrate-binding protein [Cytobacillus pseudoceanisediminis]